MHLAGLSRGGFKPPLLVLLDYFSVDAITAPAIYAATHQA